MTLPSIMRKAWTGLELGTNFGNDFHVGVIPAEFHFGSDYQLHFPGVFSASTLAFITSPEFKWSTQSGLAFKARAGMGACIENYCVAGIYAHVEKPFTTSGMSVGAGVDLWTSSLIFPGINLEGSYDTMTHSWGFFVNFRGVYPIFDYLGEPKHH